MKKQDRFERAATRAAYKLTWGKKNPDGGELQTVIVNELRKEHRWVERMIGKQQRYILEDGVMVPDKDGAWVVVNLLQDQLKQRRK